MKKNIRRRAARSLFRVGFSVLVLLCFLQAAGAANPSPEDQAKLASLQQRIDELDHAGKFHDAIPIAEERLKLVESTIGTDGPETAASCNKLAKLYRKNGDYAKARPICERGLRIREKVLGPDNLDTAESLNDLALIHVALSDLTTGEPICERALKIRERALGPNHPDTAQSLSAFSFTTTDKVEAKARCERALKIREKALGPEHPDTAESLNNLAVLYDEMDDHAKAEPLYQRALKIREKTLGPEHPETAESLANLASLYQEMGDYAKAETLCQRALKIHEKTLSPEHPDTASTLCILALVHKSMGDHAKAEPLYQRALKIFEKVFGADHPTTGVACDNLAGLYYTMGDYAKAEPLYQRALKIDEKAFGSDHPSTAINLHNLAVLYRAMGDYAKAEPLDQRVLKIREKAGGADHPETAAVLSPEDNAKLLSLDEKLGKLRQAGRFQEAIPIAQEALKLSEKALGPNHSHAGKDLNNLAELYREMGDYAKAEPLYQRALKIKEKALGSDHPDAAAILNNMALLYQSMRDYAKAEQLDQRALKIREKVLGPDHPDTATTLYNLAGLYQEMGEYAKAEPLYQRSLKINEKALGSDHPTTAEDLNNLAELYREMGDYAKAEPLYQRALKIAEKALGPDHPQTATSLNNLALLYKSMGEYAKAEPLYQRALKIREKALGPDHPDTAITLNNLAALYSAMGDYAKAEPLDQRALKIKEKTLGPDHLSTATALNNLADLYHAMGEYAKAEPLYQRALKIAEKALGPDHPSNATVLNNLAALCYETSDYAKAELLLQRALKIDEKAVGPDHPSTATDLNNLAELYRKLGDYAKAEPLYQRALKIDEKALGPDHPSTATDLNNLALLKIDTGEVEDALPLVTRARRAEERRLSNILSFTSEQQRLVFQKTTNPYVLPATLGNADELAQTVLRKKGVVLDSLLEDRLVAEASSDPKQREIIEQLRAAKQRLMQLVLEVPKDWSEQAQKKRAAEKAKLSTEVEQLEAGLARQVAGLGKARRALSVTVAQVQAAVPKQAALIELLKYRHYVGKGKFDPRYGAVLIAANGESRWVPLGSAEELDKKIQLYRKSARGQTDEATLSSILKALHDQTWAPIEKNLPSGTTTVIISPDGELSFVSFATLLTPDDRFLGEKYSIRYVASGRDLLKETKPTEGPKTTMRVFANPDFAANGDRVTLAKEETPEIALRSTEMRDLQSISLTSLPGTKKESEQLEERAKKSGWHAQASLGPNATETELRKVNSPRILHLATHGFFLPEIDLGPPPDGLTRTEADIPKGKLMNPMHRSGLAVAGAQTTLQAWAKGEVPPTESDGIVTAEEVGGLKLNDTWLVVLSACDTGSGEAKAGEGVMGLRRGFVQAGAQNLLMTLWPISDETTVNIMLDFYAAAFKTGNAPQALADTQRDWLVNLRNERGLLAAVRLAGPFIMSSQGRP